MKFGLKIYDILTDINEANLLFNLYYFSVRLDKLVINKKEKRVLAYYITIKYEEEAHDYSKSSIFAFELSPFTEKVNSAVGYTLSDSLVKDTLYDSVSQVLTLYKSGSRRTYKKAWSAIVHNLYYNEESFLSYYSKICKKGMIKYNDRHYSEELMEYMYNAYLGKNNIHERDGKAIIASLRGKWKNTNYDFDDEKVVICFDEEKLKNNSYISLAKDSQIIEDKMSDIYEATKKDLEEVYYNGSSTFLGVKFKENKEKVITIEEYADLTHYDSFKMIFDFYRFLINKRLNNNIYNDEDDEITVDEVKENVIKLRDALVKVGITKGTNGKFKFRFTKPDQVFQTVKSRSFEIRIALISIAFEQVKRIIDEKYPNYDLKKLYELDEVKYMEPDIARVFNDYVQGNALDASVLDYSFEEYLSYCTEYNDLMCYTIKESNKVYSYVPLETIDEKVKTTAIHETVASFEDGRKLFYETALDMKTCVSTIESNMKKLEYKADESDYLHVIEIESFVLDENGKFFGYITKPVECKRLTRKYLQSKSNKEVYEICSAIIDTLCNYSFHISYYNLYIDDDKKIWVNPCTDKLIGKNRINYNILYEIIDHIELNGIDSELLSKENLTSQDLIKYNYILDKYCDKHNLYYNSENQCYCDICKKSREDINKWNEEKNHSVIYEDKYAKHYQYNETYNIKMYDSKMVDLNELERVIDRSLTNKYADNKRYVQSEFLPVKKALVTSANGKDEFVGILYNKVDFNTTIDLNNTRKLSGLYGIKTLEKLLKQIKDMKNVNVLENPFGNVLLSKNYKDEVQIVNIEFIDFSGLYKRIDHYLTEYVNELLNNNEGIMYEDKRLLTVESISTWLNKAKNEYTKYCTTHKIVYHNKNICCPYCVDKEVLKATNKYILYVDPKKYYSKDSKPVNEGGEALIYRNKMNGNELVKVFKEETDLEFKLRVLLKVLARKEKFDFKDKNYKYVLPLKLLFDKNTNEFFGYTMNEVKGYPISILRDKSQVKKKKISLEEVLEILINAGEAIENLHDNANIFIGDLNGRNILFDTTCTTYFLDFDGMGIDEIKPEFCTDEYIDPVSKEANNITMKDDWFSFAIQAFHYLTYVHPYNGIYKVNGNNMDIVERMKKRISVLGNHDITLPKIAKDWKWMKPGLKNKFLNIFENGERTSIVEELKNQTEIAKGISYNSKFFDDNCFIIIDENAGVFKKIENGKMIISIKFRNKDGSVVESFIVNESKGDTITTNLFQNRKYLTYMLGNRLNVYLYENNQLKVFPEDFYVRNHVICEDILYFTVNGDPCIYVYDLIERKYKNKIRFKEELETKTFYANRGGKFIIIKHQENEDYIYCNDELFHTRHLNPASKDTNYKILYDEENAKYLIVSENGYCIVINSDGSKTTFTIDVMRNNEVILENIAFFGGNVYIPLDGRMGVYNSYIKEYRQKDTDKVNKYSSFMKKGKGFYIITENNLYDYSK